MTAVPSQDEVFDVVGGDESVADEPNREPVAGRALAEERSGKKVRSESGGENAGKTAFQNHASGERARSERRKGALRS